MIKILDFYADWCVPCRQLAPILNELEQSLDFIKIIKIDVDNDADDIAEKNGIRNIPTLLFIKDGKLVDKVVGMTSKSKLLDIINKHV